MSDKVQLIKEEIERRILQCYKCLAQDLLERERNETNCCLQQYKELLQFIDSLPEEPSVKGITWEDVNMLESLIYQVHNEYPHGIGEKSFGLEVLERFQECQDDVEEHNEDLEEAAINAWDEHVGLQLMHIEEVVAFFREAAEWQKQQMKEVLQTEYEKGRFDMREEMMKNAVGAQVFQVHDIEKA